MSLKKKVKTADEFWLATIQHIQKEETENA